ncbi:MAG: hypothetical protein JRI25_24820 [Deltaproteobacteria bacterium]|nr:hypothetical protein [Deltaproteobacteria bacterium]
MIGLVACIDLDAVRERLLPVGPARTSGAILLLLGVFLLLRLAGLAYVEIVGLESPEPFDRGLWIADFTLGLLCLVPFGLFWRKP